VPNRNKKLENFKAFKAELKFFLQDHSFYMLNEIFSFG